jgi:hypothetical protein
MDVGRVASLFIQGAESFLAGNDMVYTLGMLEPVDTDRLARAYESLVRANAILRQKWVAKGDGFDWLPFTDEELESRLALERRALTQQFSLEELYSAYHPTNTRLPLRVARVSERTLVMFVNHTWSNGYGGMYWLEHLLAAYAGEPLEHDDARAIRGPFRRILAALSGYFWALIYSIGFALKASKRAGERTVDLTHGARPVPHRAGYSVRTYRLSTEETSRFVSTAKARGESVTEALCVTLANAFLASAPPERDRVCISMPVDIGPLVPGWSRSTAPGNYTGSLVVQLFRGRPLMAQARAAFRWFARSIPYWLTALIASTAKSQRALRSRFENNAGKAIPERAPFENFTFALSSVGVLRGRFLDRYVETISGHTKTQTVFVSAVTFRDRLAIEFSVPNGLFDVQEVCCCFDRAIASLKSLDLSTRPLPSPPAESTPHAATA